MLVWLASYPRSGNTLLRQVLKRCFGLSSCEGLDPVPAGFRKPDDFHERYFGSYFLDGDPEAFYRRARTAPDLVLIKSHQPPRDTERAIYVVRDGRLALESFVAFQDAHHPGSSSFDSLLVGDHAVGDWTGHYRAWCEHNRGDMLVLRFEDLVVADASLLARLAAFLGHTGPVRPWVNPQADLRRLDPTVFGKGATMWRPGAFWTEPRLRQFYTLHGPLMVQLGYATAAEVAAGAYPAGSDESRLLQFVWSLVAYQNSTRHTNDGAGLVPGEEGTDLRETCAIRDRVLIELARRDGDRAYDARLRELERHCLRLERRLWWRRLAVFRLFRRFVRA